MKKNKYKILIVESDAYVRNLLVTALNAADYHVITAGTCALAATFTASYAPDLVLLALGLPDRDGMFYLSELRKTSATPVIVLSVRKREADKVSALDAGANDYMTKPFGMEELLARIRCALRNSRACDAARLPGGCFVLGDLMIDYDARCVTVSGKEAKLTQTEYNILAFLSEHGGKLMPYSAIIKAIWGQSDDGSIKKLQVNIGNIRRKLGERPEEPLYIVNDAGVGYRLRSEKA